MHELSHDVKKFQFGAIEWKDFSVTDLYAVAKFCINAKHVNEKIKEFCMQDPTVNGCTAHKYAVFLSNHYSKMAQSIENELSARFGEK